MAKAKGKAKTWTPATPEEKAARVKDAHDKIAKAVESIANSEEWKAFLRLGAQFHRYSFNNVMLMEIQRRSNNMSSLTRVASFAKWKQLGNPVAKGAKGLKIFAPIIVPLKQGEKGYVEGEKRTKLVGFRLTTVFDAQHTNDPNMPGLENPIRWDGSANGEVPAGLESALVKFANDNGFSVAYGNAGRAHGITVPSAKSITISDSKEFEPGSATAVAILMHEVAHMLLHCEPDPKTGEEYDYARHRGMAETEAEGTAFVVATYFGIDADSSAGYVAGWSGTETDRIVKAGTRIMATARKIIDAVDATLASAPKATDHECETCGAGKGEDCKRPSGRKTEPHAPRKRLVSA